jgi:hypothetical protein
MPEMNEQLIADGIHIGLDETLYHEDPALGSTDMGKLAVNPCDYWYESAFNLDRPERKDTPQLERGRGMHKIVLEGHAAFTKVYMRGPVNGPEFTPSEKATRTKQANAEAAKIGKTMLPAPDFDRVTIAADLIAQNPHLAGAFTGGIPEVSIFWTRDGIRRKARFDYLKPRGIGDLKSITNTMRLPFADACRRNIGTYHYWIQAAHYLEARAMLPMLFKDERMFGALPTNNAKHATTILSKCATTDSFAFQWVFFQAEGAPVTWSCIVSPANPIIQYGEREIAQATDNYRAFMDKFGPHKMWILEDAPEELNMADLPSWAMRSLNND